MDAVTESILREHAESLKLIAWPSQDGLCIGRVIDVCLMTIVSDPVNEDRYKIVQKGKTQAALSFGQCLLELEQLAAQ